MKTRKIRSLPQKLMILLFYGLVILIFGGPVLWLMSLSFREPSQIFTNPPQLLPHPFSLAAYRYIFRGHEVIGFVKNSVLLSLYTCVGALLISVPGSYALSRFRMPGKKQLILVILLFKMISPMIIIVPMYRYFMKIGMLGNHFSTALVYIAAQLPFIVYLLKGYFDSVPYSIEESAMMDGCSRIQSLLRIVLPISASGIFSAFIFTFLLAWGEFLTPFIMLSSTAEMPISVGIYLYQESRATVDTHVVSAITVITIIPPILIFWFLQRYVVQVLTAGAVKE